MIKYVLRGGSALKHLDEDLTQSASEIIEYLHAVETLKKLKGEDGEEAASCVTSNEYRRCTCDTDCISHFSCVSICSLIREYRLVREHVPTCLQNDKKARKLTARRGFVTLITIDQFLFRSGERCYPKCLSEQHCDV